MAFIRVEVVDYTMLCKLVLGVAMMFMLVLVGVGPVPGAQVAFRSTVGVRIESGTS